MSWSTCCRNSAITNLSAASSNYYIEATLNSQTALCNNSPTFTAQPIPYVCVGQPVSYSYGVIEVDGDSLDYQLISAMDGAGVNSTYNAGYSGTSPIPGITIDPLTGLVQFTPGLVGNFVVVILVTEYDAAGNVVGTVMRDIQFVVQPCSNTVPSPTAGTITGFSGSAVQTGPYAIEMCSGNCFNFSAVYTDANAGDTLTHISNIAAALPGATITPSGINPLTLNISWCAPAGTPGQNLTFTTTVQDGACPIQGQQTFVYSVNILDATTVPPDITICGAQSAQLNAYGGSLFNWTVVSGPPMTAANFSCNPCDNPIATPTATTTYAVVSNLSGTCDNTDTITVFIVPDFTYNITQSSTNSCLMQPIQLGITALTPGGAGYTYSWTPATYLSSTSISNPVATFTAPGVYSYTLSVTSPSGCVKNDSVTITVIPAVSPVITAIADTSFCVGGTANLGVVFGSGTPASCGLSATGGCGGTGSPKTVGTGTLTNTSFSYPAPYGNFYKSTKHQMLFTASDLIAAGVVAGKIDQLDLSVAIINGTTLYKNFKIDMGCTSLASLTTWQTGLVNVYTPKNHNVVTGWNAHLFDNAFEWDGISNVIMEICSDNTSDPSWTNNCEHPYTTTTYSSVIWYNIDFADACPGTPVYGTSSDRPNVRFHNCTVIANPANYSYQWTPASGVIANDTAQNTTAMPTAITTFTVTVTDIAGGCTAIDSVLVDVINLSSLTITPAGPYCVNGAIDTLSTSIPAGLGTFSGPGIISGTVGTFDPAVAGVGTHQIIYNVSGSCGTASDTAYITVIPQPDATITDPGSQCSTGPVITLNAVDAGGTWTGTGITNGTTGTFNPAIAGVGNHLITYLITTPCISQDTVLITVTTQLDATITHVGPFCTSDPAITLVAADPSGTWSGIGITNATTGTFDPSAAGPGLHEITYTITGLCGNSDIDTIIVVASPIISISSNVNQGCEPTTINFSSTNNQPGGTCSWTFGDGNTSLLCNPSNTYIYAGLYNVTFTYTNTTGCSSTVTQPGMITIHSQPVAAFVAGPQPITITNPEIHFTDMSTGVIDTWAWTFGNVGTSTQQNPDFIFPDTGSYPVQLIVTNTNGCADTSYGGISIDPIVVFYAPNAFTPNGNGVNDLFMVKGDGIDFSSFEMTIYNRWGERIFKSNSILDGWNGAKNNSGAIVQQGVYVWKVTLEDYKGLKRQYIGHVTLTR